MHGAGTGGTWLPKSSERESVEFLETVVSSNALWTDQIHEA